MNKETCKQCEFYHQPDIIPTEKVCNFPWFDYTEEDILKAACEPKEK